MSSEREAERESKTMGNPRNIRRLALPVVAAVVLIVASTVMPWATYKDVSTDATTTFHGGQLGLGLVALGAATIVSSPGLLTRLSTPVSRLHVVVGSAALVGSIVLALHRISQANSTISLANGVTQPGPTRTSYAFGAGVAIVASTAIALMSVLRVSEARSAAATPSKDS